MMPPGYFIKRAAGTAGILFAAPLFQPVIFFLVILHEPAERFAQIPHRIVVLAPVVHSGVLLPFKLTARHVVVKALQQKGFDERLICSPGQGKFLPRQLLRDGVHVLDGLRGGQLTFEFHVHG